MRRLFHAGVFIDGSGKEPEKGVYFSVDEGRIASVGRKDDYAFADVATVCDFADCSVLPGLIDSHVHLFMEGVFDLQERSRRRKEEGKDITLIRAVNNLRRTLQKGVTSVRDLGGSYEIGTILKKAVRQNIIPGPGVLTANRAISITGGHFHYAGGREADGAAEISKAVREQVKAGADCVKFMLTGSVNFVRGDAGFVEYSPAETESLIREAQRLGRLTSVHANGVQGVRQALEFGVDTLEHGALLDAATVDLLSEKGVYWAPTLLPFQRMLDYSRIYDAPSLPYDGISRVYEKHMEMVGRAVRQKAKIIAGTDAGALGVEHGDVWRELALLVKCGMTPAAAVHAATGLAAGALGLSGDTGVLAQGRQADFIAVRGDVTADINCLAQVEKVYQGGKLSI